MPPPGTAKRRPWIETVSVAISLVFRITFGPPIPADGSADARRFGVFDIVIG